MVDDCQTLQDIFLNELKKGNDTLSVYLINGIKLQGHLVDFDQHCIKLKNANGIEQMIYKSAISTLAPVK